METKKIDTRLSGMLGFAMRAGKLVLGTEQVCLAMAKTRADKKPRLILAAHGISDATHKKLSTKAQFYHIPHYDLPIDQSHLGDLLGKSCLVAAVAVMDDGFAKQLSLRLDELGALTADEAYTSQTTRQKSLRKEVSHDGETGMTDGAD